MNIAYDRRRGGRKTLSLNPYVRGGLMEAETHTLLTEPKRSAGQL